MAAGDESDLAAIKAWESGLWQTIDARPLLAKIQCPTLVLEVEQRIAVADHLIGCLAAFTKIHPLLQSGHGVDTTSPASSEFDEAVDGQAYRSFTGDPVSRLTTPPGGDAGSRPTHLPPRAP